MNLYESFDSRLIIDGSEVTSTPIDATKRTQWRRKETRHWKLNVFFSTSGTEKRHRRGEQKTEEQFKSFRMGRYFPIHIRPERAGVRQLLLPPSIAFLLLLLLILILILSFSLHMVFFSFLFVTLSSSLSFFLSCFFLFLMRWLVWHMSKGTWPIRVIWHLWPIYCGFYSPANAYELRATIAVGVYRLTT